MYTRYYDSYPANQYARGRTKSSKVKEDSQPEPLPCQREGDSSAAKELTAANQLADSPAPVLDGPVSEEKDERISPELASLNNGIFGSLGNLKTDDILLIAVLLLIISESKDDFIMPLILGYLLLGEIL